MSTTLVKPAEVERKWYLLDAAGKSLGHVAAEAAVLLRGILAVQCCGGRGAFFHFFRALFQCRYGQRLCGYCQKTCHRIPTFPYITVYSLFRDSFFFASRARSQLSQGSSPSPFAADSSKMGASAFRPRMSDLALSMLKFV